MCGGSNALKRTVVKAREEFPFSLLFPTNKRTHSGLPMVADGKRELNRYAVTLPAAAQTPKRRCWVGLFRALAAKSRQGSYLIIKRTMCVLPAAAAAAPAHWTLPGEVKVLCRSPSRRLNRGVSFASLFSAHVVCVNRQAIGRKPDTEPRTYSLIA